MSAQFELLMASVLDDDPSDRSGQGGVRGPRRPPAAMASGGVVVDRIAEPEERALLDTLRAEPERPAELAFSRIYYHYAEPLCRFAARLTGSWAEAEEIVHDVLGNVWRQRRQVVPKGRLAAYLFRAVRNRAINVHHHDDVIARIAHEPSASTAGVGEGPGAPDRDVLVRELRDALRAAVASLPERRRTALTLRYVHQLSFDQIGDVLGVSEKAAFILVSRTRESLRPLFERFLKN